MTHTYVCLVHSEWKEPGGGDRYLVGARSETEARAVLAAKTGSGSVEVYYRATDESGEIPPGRTEEKMKYGQVKRL